MGITVGTTKKYSSHWRICSQIILKIKRLKPHAHRMKITWILITNLTTDSPWKRFKAASSVPASPGVSILIFHWFRASELKGTLDLSRSPGETHIEVSTFFAFERDMKNKTKGTVKEWKFQLNWRVLFTCCYYRNPVAVADVVSMVSQTIETGDWKSKLYMRSGPYFTMVLQV